MRTVPSGMQSDVVTCHWESNADEDCAIMMVCELLKSSSLFLLRSSSNFQCSTTLQKLAMLPSSAKGNSAYRETSD